MFPLSDTRVRMLLSRMGSEAVHRRKASGSVDQLNHSTGEYATIGTVLCALYKPGMAAGNADAGELSLETTRLAFPRDAGVRPNDHIVLDGVVYELESVVDRGAIIFAAASATA